MTFLFQQYTHSHAYDRVVINDKNLAHSAPPEEITCIHTNAIARKISSGWILSRSIILILLVLRKILHDKNPTPTPLRSMSTCPRGSPSPPTTGITLSREIFRHHNEPPLQPLSGSAEFHESINFGLIRLKIMDFLS
ncbi:hypothetical protein D3C80_1555650 [compost metagenome]